MNVTGTITMSMRELDRLRVIQAVRHAISGNRGSRRAVAKFRQAAPLPVNTYRVTNT